MLFGLSCEFSVELHHLLRTRQLGASGASGSRSVFCQLSVMKKEKLLRALVAKTTKISNLLRVQRLMDYKEESKQP